MSVQDENVNAPTQEIVETTADDKGEKKIGDILAPTEAPKEEPKEDKQEDSSVPVAKFLAEKKARKALEKRVKELEEAVNSALEDDDVDVAKEVKSLADEYGVDPKFLKNLTNTLEKQLEDKFDKKVAPIVKEKRQEEINKIFKQHFDETIEVMQEYKSIVNPEVIKSLSLDPSNANLTLRQLIEKTYGNALGGRRTIETTTPNGGKEPQNVDFDKAKNDPEYYSQVMADPSLKEKYNAEMMRRFSRGF